MRRTVYALSAALLVILAVALVPALSQEAKPMAELKSLDEQWAELHTPGAEHTWLAEATGEWKIAGKMWQQGISEPQEMSGKATLKMLHERYLYEEATLGEGETAMHHFGYIGYDMSSKNFQALYAGNMGTGLKVMDGKRSGEVLTFSCEVNEPSLNLKGTSRVVLTRVSKDKMTVDMYRTVNNTPEYKCMELIYTR